MTFDQSFSDFSYGFSTYATDEIDLYEINREFHALKLRFESIV